eukprot:TRINITY_DN1771_c1_g1_i1.p1 TRINITY_DN1771_c1_g1~~TRINITY_DN1771_c1_g1_i1.p1  ORF type:complete len:483 (+),score=177.07 TRINITY_DN1771_c1_g1_i1:108-1556(+)
MAIVQDEKEIKEKVEKLKNEGNSYFSMFRFEQAVESYSSALKFEELIDSPLAAIIYSNRAFAHLKLENYGLAITDADRCTTLQPSYPKGFYRRGAANMALRKYKEAKRDFQKVIALGIKDNDLALKLKECDQEIRRIAFEDAIACEEPPLPSSIINLNAITIENSYDGPHLGETITYEFVQQLIEALKAQKVLHKKYLIRILIELKDILKNLPSLVNVNFNENESLIVCGDTHGQFYDLVNILELSKFPNENQHILFNGDFVDRGSFSVEVVVTLFAFKLLFPNNFHLTRGNHETKAMNQIYGFQGEVKSKYNSEIYDLFCEIFTYLPLAYVINSKVFVVHGGLPNSDTARLQDIANINRFREPPESGLMSDLLWSDPHNGNGRIASKRGVGTSFGADITAQFCHNNNLDLIVRSHEVQDLGYKIDHNGKCITIFSAPNYCDQVGNKGAFIIFKHNLIPEFVTYDSVPHPKIPPMKYVSNFF